MKNNIKQPTLALNTPLLLKAWSKITWDCFEKQITYSEWVNFKKNYLYEYYVYKI